jgi:hypothetical protein
MTRARDLSKLLGTNSNGVIDNTNITLDAAEVPSLDTAKITTGTFASARIDNNSLSAITTLPSGVGGTAWQTIITGATLTAVAGRGYWINTTSNACTVTLPASATNGDTIILVDYARKWGTNAVTINTNSLKFQGNTSPNPVYNTSGQSVTLIYSGATQGWIPTVDDDVTDEVPQTYSIDFLVIAGGGSGGASGGGGAGGYRTSTQTVNASTVITVTVGDGGTAITTGTYNGNNGSNSSISGSGLTTITSAGGGAGMNNVGANGGSGGGGNGGNDGGSGNTPSTSPSQGNNGGRGEYSAPYSGGGGGGGAGAVGGAMVGSVNGSGGNGTASSITGSSVTRAGGGGGGGGVPHTAGSGGSGGGGAGIIGESTATSGTANTGGGGGGMGYPYFASGAGGKGVVILSMLTSKYSATSSGSPTVTTSGSNTILQFNGSGSYTG